MRLPRALNLGAVDGEQHIADEKPRRGARDVTVIDMIHDDADRPIRIPHLRMADAELLAALCLM